jgi:chromate transporter
MSGTADLYGLMMHFGTLSFLAVSGAIAMAPDMHRFLVDEKHWMTHTQFSDSIALAQAAPGPNILFVALLGFQAASWPGAVVALGSMVIPSSVLVYMTWRWKKSREDSHLVKALRLGLSPVAVGLTISTGLVLIRTAAVPDTGFVLDWRIASLIGLSIATLAFSLKSKRNPLWMIGCGAVVGMLISLGGT